MPDDDVARSREALEGLVGASRLNASWPEGALLPGTRVRVAQDPEWRQEFTGTIDAAIPPELINHPMAHPGELAYFVAFDEPQHDTSSDGPYRKAQIWARYLVEINEG
ncbi:MAG: hypothetical protein QOJ29_3834 [Thermoleophilaceae bacterium]|jgi:hypothetical protein|nr:hypothetical protein [Thermoleophilaceae bacterium]